MTEDVKQVLSLTQKTVETISCRSTKIIQIFLDNTVIIQLCGREFPEQQPYPSIKKMSIKYYSYFIDQHLKTCV